MTRKRKQPIWRQVGTKTVRRWNNAKERVSARFKLAGTNEQMECAPVERKNKEGGREGRGGRETRSCIILVWSYLKDDREAGSATTVVIL